MRGIGLIRAEQVPGYRKAFGLWPLLAYQLPGLSVVPHIYD
jgi:hypothetical protein